VTFWPGRRRRSRGQAARRDHLARHRRLPGRRSPPHVPRGRRRPGHLVRRPAPRRPAGRRAARGPRTDPARGPRPRRRRDDLRPDRRRPGAGRHQPRRVDRDDRGDAAGDHEHRPAAG
jgi:hypothetical protein